MAYGDMQPAVSGQSASSSEYNKVVGHVEDLDTRVTSISGTVTSGSIGNSALAAKVNDATKGNDALSAKVNDATIGNTPLAAKVNDATKGNDALTAKVNSATIGNTPLGAKVNDATKGNDALNTRVAAVETTVNDGTTGVAALASKVNNGTIGNSALSARIVAMENRVVAHGLRTTASTASASTTFVPVLRLDSVMLYNNHMYQITTNSLILTTTAAGNAARVNVRYSSSGAATVASTVVPGSEWSALLDSNPSAGVYTANCISATTFVPSATGVYSLLLDFRRDVGANSVVIDANAADRTIILDVVDLGYAAANTAVIL
jgi:hypothetical protein